MGTIEQQLTSIVARREYHYKTAIANFLTLDKEDRTIEFVEELRGLKVKLRNSGMELLNYLETSHC